VVAAGRPAARGAAVPGTARAGGAAVGGGALLVAGILALAFNLRAAVTGLPPLFPELAAHGLSAAAEAALAALPVLCFAACSGLAPAAARRLGEERVLGLALVLLAAGLGLRAAAPVVLLFPGTILASGAIALINVLLPSLIKRRQPDRAGLLIGLYLLSLTAGAVVALLLAVPVYTAVAGSSAGTNAAVRLTLGMWAIPALAAAVAWLPQRRFRASPAGRGALGPGGGGVMALARRALAWQVMAYMGLQSLSYYATLSWFPTMFRDHGIGAAAAGNLVALMTAGNAVTALVAPLLAQRMTDQRLLSAVAVAAIMIGTAGSVFGSAATAIGFAAVLGLGQGAAFGLAIFLFTARAADGRTAAALSGFAQGGGYLVAAAGPLLIGLLHTATGGWAVPAWVLLVVAAGQLAVGLLAGRNRQLSLDEAIGNPPAAIP
jgi:MFS transporter, CP family, cyanate transporter